MSKPKKPTPTKKRKLARVVISGAGTTQRPLDPTVARFARRIATAFSGTTPDEHQHHAGNPAERPNTMKKLVAIRSQARALTQPPRKSPPAKAPPSKAEVDFDRAVQFRKTCPLLTAAPAAKRRMRATALAYAAELTVKKGGKR